MKKIILALITLSICYSSFAQNDKYAAIMKDNISIIDTAITAENLKTTGNVFDRIAKKETTEWLPNYYAALALVKYGYSKKLSGDEVDNNMAKAQEYVTNAESILNTKNSDLLLLKAMIINSRIMVNPMTRGAQLGGQANALIKEARELDPTNPRGDLLQGQSLYFTPAMFGGDKKKALLLFESALKKFDTFKPESELHPKWGKEETQYFIDLANKK